MPRQGNLTWIQQNLIQKCEDNYFMLGRLRQYNPVTVPQRRDFQSINYGLA